MRGPEKQIYHVLVADDSDDDRDLLRQAMRSAARLKIVAEAGDGGETIAYLKGHGKFANREKFPVPDLLLLDLKMPVKDGFAVLEWLGGREFRELTVVVLTDSMESAHLKRALDLGADLFQVKPLGSEDREAFILALEQQIVTSNAPARRSFGVRGH